MSRQIDQNGTGRTSDIRRPMKPTNPTKPQTKKRRTCRICRASNREVIEAILMNGASFESNARLISAEYDLKVSAYTVRLHLLNHPMTERTKRIGLRLKELAEGEEPYLTARGIHGLLLKEAFQKVLTGEAEVKTMNDVLRVLEMDNAREKVEREMQETDEARHGRQAMEQLGFVLQSLRETIPPEHLDRAMTRAVALGLDEGLLSA